MSIETWAFIGGFCGSALGISGGFLGVEVIKLLVSRRDLPHPHAEIMEWATSQLGVSITHETQVANTWIRTYDVSGIAADDEGDRVSLELPYTYVTVVVGGARELRSLMTDSSTEAEANHAHMVNQVRRALRIIPK